MARSRLRRYADLLRRTPLHPQWLLRAELTRAARLEGIESGRVLDIGCADRWIERHLSPSCEYVGIDYPVTGLSIYGARPHIFADASSLPLTDASIDTVVIFEVVEHLLHPRKALCEIARVLKPNGRMLLTMPFLYPIHDAPHDYQRYTVHGLIREVEAAGLRVDSVEPSLGSAETAGLICCLALGGMAVQVLRQRSLNIVLIPLLAMAIPVINVLAWLGGRLLPSWSAVAGGYALSASKP